MKGSDKRMKDILDHELSILNHVFSDDYRKSTISKQFKINKMPDMQFCIIMIVFVAVYFALLLTPFFKG